MDSNLCPYQSLDSFPPTTSFDSLQSHDIYHMTSHATRPLPPLNLHSPQLLPLARLPSQTNDPLRTFLSLWTHISILPLWTDVPHVTPLSV